ncbi:Conserved oligomeric Golgi complex subunit 5 [Camellia lanceoleosa]|nr:Conserved oligomeric Golgi complex subunit 5 [Camellia lanceoleosa]
MSKYKSQAVKSVSVALDMKAISAWSSEGYGLGGIQRIGTPQIGSGRKAKEALSQRMSTYMDQLHSIVVVVWHLQTILSKKRDSFTHILLLDEVMQSKSEEKKTEKIGSEERESSGDDENGMEDGGDVMVPTAEVGVAVLVVLSLKVKRH